MKDYVVKLKESQRLELSKIVRERSHSADKIINALILLNCDEGKHSIEEIPDDVVAKVLQISEREIRLVRESFFKRGMKSALEGSACEQKLNVHTTENDDAVPRPRSNSELGPFFSRPIPYNRWTILFLS